MSVEESQHTPLLHVDELMPECPGTSLEEATFQKDCECNSYEGILLTTKSVDFYGKLSIYVEGKGEWQGTNPSVPPPEFLLCELGKLVRCTYCRHTGSEYLPVLSVLDFLKLNGISLDCEGKPENLVLGVLIPERNEK